jgi:beta-lactamase class A
MNKKVRNVCLVLVVLLLASNVFIYLELNRQRKVNQRQALEYENWYKGYNMLSSDIKKLPLDSNQDPDRILLHFVPLKEKILKEVGNLAENQKIALYVQDANSGSWLGINESERFVPASLLKVPIAMAIYKRYESGEINLDDELIVREEDIDKEAGVPERYTIGHSYKVKELLEWMLKISDNTAKNILKGSLDPEELNSVFTHVAIENPYTAEAANQNISPRQYERMFKALFFSTYLKPENSQALLTLLTDTRVEGLLSAKLPWEIQVAHKYGERNDALHDCGIVYNKQNPYFICVMTSGIGIEQSKLLINDISLEVYKYFNSEN